MKFWQSVECPTYNKPFEFVPDLYHEPDPGIIDLLLSLLLLFYTLGIKDPEGFGEKK